MEAAGATLRCLGNVCNPLNWLEADTFKQTRYGLVNQGKVAGGSLSLGYSHGDLKVYWTKMVGQEGCLDWNVSDLIGKLRSAATEGKLTPDIKNLLQSISNQLMPGLSGDILGNHFFVRPHFKGTQIGFQCNITNSARMDELATRTHTVICDTLQSFVPLTSFVFRSHSEQISIGTIGADLFVSVKPDSTVFFMLSIRFLFDPFPAAVSAVQSGFKAGGNGVDNNAPLISATDDSDAPNATSNADHPSSQQFGTQDESTDTIDGGAVSNDKQSSQQQSMKKVASGKMMSSSNVDGMKWLMPWVDSKWRVLTMGLLGVAVGTSVIKEVPSAFSKIGYSAKL